MRPQERTAKAEVAAAVFQNAHIPRKLDEVADFERDAEHLRAGHDDHIFFQIVSGMTRDGTRAATGVPQVLLNALQSENDICAGCTHSESATELADAAAQPGPSLQQSAQNQHHHSKVSAQHRNAYLLSSQGSQQGSEAQLSSRSASSRSSSSCSSVHSGTGQAQAALEVQVQLHHPKDASKPTHEDLKAARKENKQAVKADRAERRTHKIPKKVKKAAEKKGKHKK